MKKVKVAIFTAYHNRENDVKESIESLLNQNYNNFIVVAINDGSSDTTLDRLQEIKNDKLIILNKKNSGFVSSIIYAINKVDSEYIAIHGSGDISLPDRIKLQAQVLDDNSNVGVVGCHYKNNDLIRNKSIEFTSLSGLIHKRIMLDHLCVKNPLTHGEVTIRRSVYNKVGGYNPFFTFAQDYELWIRLSQLTDFYIVPEVLYLRYVRSDGVSGSVNKIAVQQYLASMARMNAKEIKLNLNILSFLNKKRDSILIKRLFKLNVRALLLEKGYPYNLAKINMLELGPIAIVINFALNLCRLRRP